MSLLRRGPTGPDSQAERQQKAQLRSIRMERTREARLATRDMVAPEHKYGIYVSLVMIALALYSYLSTDLIAVDKTVHGKTKLVDSTITHPAQALVLLVFALGAASTIYWHRRMVTGITYIVTGFFSVQTPFPKTASGIQYVVFLVPAAYGFWMLMFRMNKDQKAWINEHYPPPDGSGAAARSSSRRSSTSSARSSRNSGARAARGSAGAPTGSRTAQIRSGRYTPPRTKAKAGQRKPT